MSENPLLHQIDCGRLVKHSRLSEIISTTGGRGSMGCSILLLNMTLNGESRVSLRYKLIADLSQDNRAQR